MQDRVMYISRRSQTSRIYMQDFIVFSKIHIGDRTDLVWSSGLFSTRLASIT